MTTKTDNHIKLDAWLVERKRALEAFAADWRKHQDADPDGWPETMGPGEWDEQYAAYMATHDD